MARHLLLVSIAWSSVFALCAYADDHAPSFAKSVSVTILSSNLASSVTIGEWGFSALAEVDGNCVLFDTGRNPDTVLRNAKALGVDLLCVTDIVLSHFHFDHTDGLLPVLAHLSENNAATPRIHAATGIFAPRRWRERPDGEANQMIALRERLDAQGIHINQYAKPTEILPAVWVTGPVERSHDERLWSAAMQVRLYGRWVADHIPESQGLTIKTAKGPIVILGCGHSGSVNMLTHVRSKIQDHRIHALMGGMHLKSADDDTLTWTSEKLRELGVQHLMAGHCTGIEPMFRLRKGLDLTRKTAVVGAVGSRFVYGEGIYPTSIAQ